jgi:transcriptional antiterminator RfaH
MSYWACARLAPHRYEPALYFLELAGYRTYLPKCRERRRLPNNRQVEVAAPLFPSYAFVWIELQWRVARWTPGVIGFIMIGESPAHVPEQLIDTLKSRERDGVIDLPRPRPRAYLRGDRIRIRHGPFAGQPAIYSGMRPRDRVAVLLTMLGSSRPIELARSVIEPVDAVE